MPREFVHLTVLDKVVSMLEDSPLSVMQSAIKQHLPYAQIGSMLHDAPYYLNRGKSSVGVALGAFLHGRDAEDSFAPLRAFYQALEKVADAELKAAGLALLAGMISHAETDITFHPLIFYFTGNYYDPDPQKRALARKRHRLLETYLDCYLIERAQVKPIVLNDIKRQCNTKTLNQLLTIFVNSLNELCDYPITSSTILVKAYREMSLYQRLFTSQPAAILAKIINEISFRKLAAFEVLFCRFKKTDFTFFSQSIYYQHPVTNSSCKTSIDKLLESSAVSTLARLKLIDNCLNGDCFDFLAYQGPSLNTGLLNTNSNDLKYFSGQLLDFPDF